MSFLNRKFIPNRVAQFIDRIYSIPLIESIIRHRFIKFGTVGFSGTIVNLAVLYINQEILFKNVCPPEKRLHLSLSGAIFVATLNNFFWNRIWTWSDRDRKSGFGVFLQAGQYFLACGAAIFFQYFFTILLSKYMHYLLSNIISIILAAILAYILNDIWTFTLKKDQKTTK